MKTTELNDYKGVVLFVVCLLAANFFWKFTVQGDEGVNEVFWLGLNITPPFRVLSEHIAQVVYRLTRLFTDAVHFESPYTVVFDSGFAYSVVWSCTALKQSFIWLIIMLFARGGIRHKLWFIPLGWICAYMFNILRIVLIGLLSEHHPENFELYHTIVFKYLFYGMFFGLWVLWDVKIRTMDNREDENNG